MKLQTHSPEWGSNTILLSVSRKDDKSHKKKIVLNGLDRQLVVEKISVLLF